MNEGVSQENQQGMSGAEESAEQEIIHAPGRAIEVKLKLYEGPLDLLLEIIRKNEIDIFDIPMAQVTEQYMTYLGEMKKLNLEIAGEFMVVAATLIYIKSKMLLPQEADKPEEEGGDPRQELVRKLLEYQAFREAAKELSTLESERAQEFTRQISDYYFKEISGDSIEIDTFSANLYDLMSAFHQVIKNWAKDSFHSVFQEVISIDEKIDQLKQLLAERKTIRFSELFSPETSRNELIVTFLALLELVKSKFIRVIQPERFGEISITRREEETKAIHEPQSA